MSTVLLAQKAMPVWCCQITADVARSRSKEQYDMPRARNSILRNINSFSRQNKAKPCSTALNRASLGRYRKPLGLVVCCSSVPSPATAGGDRSERLDEKSVKEETQNGRRIVYAVDGTTYSEEGLRWLTRNIAKKGDKVHLAHVLCDPRTPSTAVGSSTAATQWSPVRDEQVFAKEFQSRAEHEATEMIESRYVPSVEMNGIDYEINLLPLKVHKSAGGIGETLVNGSLNMGADLLVIASHGAGVRTDYGSVARWCNENSPVPTMLLPPSTLSASSNTRIQMGASNAILVGAADDLDGLKRCFDYAITDHTRPGDGVYVVHAIDDSGKTEDEVVTMRKHLVGQVLKWQAESPISHAASLNVAVHLIVSRASESSSSSSDDELAPDISPAGSEICDMAGQLNVRTVILAHHGKNFMREMLYKPLTMHCINHCQSPLVVLDGLSHTGEAVAGY